jgi:hypothetical protein
MGVKDGCLGGLTPVCNECGGAESYEISHEEYNEHPDYWEDWLCPDCRKYNEKTKSVHLRRGNNVW